MSMPSLPQITDVDLLLELYTHPNIRPPQAPSHSQWGDIERLEALGVHVYDLVLSFHYFNARPMLSRQEMDQQREAQKDPVVIDGWLAHYHIKDKMRMAPADQHLLETHEEILRIFHSFIGAVYTCSGLQVVQTWISSLIDPTVQVALPGGSNPNPTPPYSPPRSNLMAYTPSMRADDVAMHPIPPPGPPPPLPPTPGQSQPLHQYAVPTLALINQTAAQKGYTLSYPAQQEGPPHAPTWTVRCLVNQQEAGVGVGRSQKLAKEEAARQAWVTMGWGSA